MVQAVLVEDECNTRQFIAEQLKIEFSRQNEELQIAAYESGERFWQVLQEYYHYDILFLDIEMPGIDGIALAEKIRKIMPHMLLVFISNQEQLVFKSFEVQPFRFIRKQEFMAQLPHLTMDLLEKIREENRRVIYLTEPGTGDLYSFDIYSLLYVEAQRKDCRLVTSSGETLLRSTIGYLREQLSAWRFIQCHRSYLVNWLAVRHIGKTEIYLTNGTQIPLSRGLAKKVQEQFMHIVQSEVL